MQEKSDITLQLLLSVQENEVEDTTNAPKFSYKTPLIKPNKTSTTVDVIERERTSELLFTKTATIPSFLVVGPTHYQAHGLTIGFVMRFGVWAYAETSIFRMILNNRCHEKKNAVIDVGANMGYFALYSASFGCRVKAYEPHPGPYYFFQISSYLNKFNDLIEMNNKGVDDKAGGFYMGNIDDWSIAKVEDEGIYVETVSLDDVIKENILLLKIDVEGYEDNVLKNFNSLLAKYDIENIVCETKYMRDIEFKRLFINSMMNDYVVITYEEEYHTGYLLEPEMLVCSVVTKLNDDEWIEFEDLWYIKKDSNSNSGTIEN